MENTIKAEGIDCKFERVDAYLIPYSDSPVEWLKLENELPAAHDVSHPLHVCKLQTCCGHQQSAFGALVTCCVLGCFASGSRGKPDLTAY